MTLNDEKRQDEDETEGVSERRDETRRARGGWGWASLGRRKGGLMKREVEREQRGEKATD